MASRPLDCCFADISTQNNVMSRNLIIDNSLQCKEKLLFLYSFIERRGKNLYAYPNIISNIRRMCPNLKCCDTTVPVFQGEDIIVNLRLVCSDDILAEGIIIYT